MDLGKFVKNQIPDSETEAAGVTKVLDYWFSKLVEEQPKKLLKHLDFVPYERRICIL